MQLASLEQHYWQLQSAEEMHQQFPNTFWIPPLEERENLKRGQAAKLLFDIESEDENGSIQLGRERIWVIVSERHNDFYIGILDGQPASVDDSDETYLCFGAEIPFLPEHIIDIAQPPKEYTDWQLSQLPERLWARE